MPEELDDFLRRYELATNTHDFDNVRPLIHSDAVYFFSNASLYGIEAIEKAFGHVYKTIQNEKYSIRDVRWLTRDETTAVCVYDFEWVGFIDGTKRRGSGRGTNVLVNRNGSWFMLHEHLSVPRGASY